jgi:chemotaxis protein methyltransferase CheR
VNEAEFDFLRAVVRRRSGLALGSDKRALVTARLQSLVADHRFDTLGELVRALGASESSGLAQAVCDALATQETMFFRDRAVFDALRSEVLPRLIAARARTRHLRIWSAATSTGQEAYSIALVLDEFAANLRGWTIDLLATDMSAASIARARCGLYSPFEVARGLPARPLQERFSELAGGWQIADRLRAAIDFRVFNLLDDFRPLGRFDLILCRNVLIYFDQPTKVDVLDRLADALADDGFLCLGSAENVLGLGGALVSHAEVRGFLSRAERRACDPPPARAAV